MMSNAILFYLHELASRVVAQSGIASDRYHVGKIILRSLQDAPDLIMQVTFFFIFYITLNHFFFHVIM